MRLKVYKKNAKNVSRFKKDVHIWRGDIAPLPYKEEKNLKHSSTPIKDNSQITLKNAMMTEFPKPS